MANGPKLELRQSQSLVMTPQLQQSIKLLQMSSMELTEFLEQAALSNPILSLDDGSREGEEGAAGAASGDDGDGTMDDLYGEDYADLWDDEFHTPDQSLAPLEQTLTIRQSDGGGDEDDSPWIERMSAGGVSLRDHLQEQLHVDVTDPVRRIIGTHLIDMLDDSGYLRDDIAPLAQLLGCHPGLIEETIAQLQGFDPPGVFARDLKECLAIQLKERDRLDPAMAALLEHLNLVADKDMKALQRLCGVSREDLDDMLAEIRALNPRPASGFAMEAPSTVTPDVVVRKLNKGWKVELNPDALPRILVNQQYYGMVVSRARNAADKKFINDSMSEANWIAKALDQRARNMLNVAGEIVERQQEFLNIGISGLKPMVLREIAAKLGIHESTVSRVTANKYIQTPRGTYEMKYFFSSSIQSSFGGDDISSEAVKHAIRQLIEGESPSEILSDDDLATMLKDKGMDVARRTVAKYREAMGFGSSVQRRKEKRLR